MEWADGAVWRATLAQPATEEDAKIRGLLLHIHVVQRAFLAVWTDGPLTFPEPDEFPSLGGIRDWARPYLRRGPAVSGVARRGRARPAGDDAVDRGVPGPGRAHVRDADAVRNNLPGRQPLHLSPRPGERPAARARRRAAARRLHRLDLVRTSKPGRRCTAWVHWGACVYWTECTDIDCHRCSRITSTFDDTKTTRSKSSSFAPPGRAGRTSTRWRQRYSCDSMPRAHPP